MEFKKIVNVDNDVALLNFVQAKQLLDAKIKTNPDDLDGITALKTNLKFNRKNLIEEIIAQIDDYIG